MKNDKCRADAVINEIYELTAKKQIEKISLERLTATIEALEKRVNK